MQIVIDIPEETYNEVCWRGLALCPRDDANLVKAIRNGMSLPKGHGRLIDISRIEKDKIEKDNPIICLTIDDNYTEAISLDYLNNLPTIIEADKEYEAEVITRGNCMICGKELDEGLFFCKECEAKAESEVEE